MSQENVEIVRRQFKLWSEGDLGGWGQCWTHDVVVIPPDRWPEGGDIEAWMRGVAKLSACAIPGSRRASRLTRYGPSGRIRWSAGSAT